MIGVLVFIVLLWQFYLGYSRKIILQSFYAFGGIVSLIIAKMYYLQMAEQITLWLPYSNPSEGAVIYFFKSVDPLKLSSVYYSGASFLLISSLVYLLWRFVGIFLHFAPIDKIDGNEWNALSGFLSVAMTILFLSMVFTVMGTVPITQIQSYLHYHAILRFLIDKVPVFSALLHKLWMVGV